MTGRKARTMTEVLFYHLQDTTLERVLPPLLEKSLARGWRVAVQTGSEERAEAIDAHLWTGARIRSCRTALARRRRRGAAGGAGGWTRPTRTAPMSLHRRQRGLPADCDSYARVVMVFNGDDDEALGGARGVVGRQGARFEITYWQTDERGRWQQRA